MSEFEKQWEEYVKTFPPQFESVIESFKPAIKRFWKAALEWALSKQKQIDWRFNPIILPKDVEQELEQLNQSNRQSDNSPQSNTPS